MYPSRSIRNSAHSHCYDLRCYLSSFLSSTPLCYFIDDIMRLLWSRTTPRKSGCEQEFLWLNSLNHCFTQAILIYLWGI
uniref:Uncharacterized protein n=1 Tax=Picea glauca TaxID=3330 RepID=A0A124GP07_PICGL|nr:hypothetical protein ABT39_MTgene309 [Picea glauca]QHR90694.1 hypothetical protein Q903MT_gene4719 [Picea sitchensis]